MITTFAIRASSTIGFTTKRATSARSSSHKNGWTEKWPIASCVKQWPQSVHLASGRPSFTISFEILAPAGGTRLNKFSRQFHRPAQETQIMLARNFDRAKLL